MYAKLFASLYQGTLRGCSDEILVFTNLLAHADISGIVDKHWRAISEETGLPRDRVEAAIAVLEAPDPESRSPEQEGRRLLRLDEHRGWGWRIVNHAKYRAIRNEDDRREQNRIAQERWRNKQSKPRKPEKAHTEAEAEAEALKPSAPTGARLPAEPEDHKVSAYAVPDCPYSGLVDLYHETLPELPKLEVMSDLRKGFIKGRWRQVCADFKFSKQDALDWFRAFFVEVGQSEFLMGRSSSKDRQPFRADLEWLMRPNNFAKTVEGRYNRGAR